MKLIKLLYRFLFSRFFFVSATIMLQMIFLYGFLMNVMESNFFFEFGAILSYVLNFVLTVRIINQNKNPSYKMAWLVFIHMLPVFGGLLYLLLANHKIPRNLRRGMIKNLVVSRGYLRQNPQYQNVVDDDVRPQLEYVLRNAYYPYYQNTDTRYFPSGEASFEAMKQDLLAAKHFIFMEFFIVKTGSLYEEIRDILIKKVQEGVEVYFMYDDGGSLTTSDHNFAHELNSYGIKTVVFNPISIRFMLLSKSNNRDHRKIVVMDNAVAYVGGINLADEYANRIQRFGYWKDTALRLQGEAVRNLSAMFIQFFNASGDWHLSYQKYVCQVPPAPQKESYVLPFSDSPTDAEDVAHTVHLNMIHEARKYLYIATPYLILDYGMSEALRNAAKRGVEVHIIVPHIPDKKMVFVVTQSNYEILMQAGVHVHEYTPGFIHAKQIVADDKIALIGTINMDFRSYYLHYECGVLLTDFDTIMQMKQDFLAIKAVSQEIRWKDLAKVSWIKRLLQQIMSAFSPLL